ncbi:MAG: Crp/Fnr family transcriptional regulator [Deltaproteobacteria bacterium]|nr:Crp/Fnr family transcriptional regulator [Deltaproteobacteria bacterium]
MKETKILHDFPLLQGLTEEEHKHLLKHLIYREVDKGTYLMTEGEQGETMYFIVRGKVKVVSASDEGKECIIAYIRPREVVGELSLITGNNRTADVVTVEPTSFFALRKTDYENHIVSNNGFIRAILGQIANRLCSASEKIGDLMLLDVNQRVESTLVRLAKDCSGPENIITKRPTHQELAALVGTSREMITRALKRLEEDERIQIEGKEIRLL